MGVGVYFILFFLFVLCIFVKYWFLMDIFLVLEGYDYYIKMLFKIRVNFFFEFYM